MLGSLIFIISWIACFVFAYSTWYRIIMLNNREFSPLNRLVTICIASTYVIGAISGLIIGLAEGVFSSNWIGVKPDGFFGKILKNLEKDK